MTKQPSPYEAIIIPHYNDVARLSRLLEALDVQNLAGTEVIVADNGSSVDLVPVQVRFPWVRIVSEPQSGAGLARNKGVSETTAPWLFFIDSDCLPASDWLEHARRIATGELYTITGGRVDVFDETSPPRSGAEAFEAIFAFKMRRYLEEEAFLGAGNLVVSRVAFEATGGFRATVSEDKEWSQRAAAKGFVLAYDDDLIVGHPSRQDWMALSRKWLRLTDEAWALRRARGGGRFGWIIRALAMPASIFLHAPKIATHRDLSVAERMRAATTLTRLRLARMIWMLHQALARPR